MGYKSILTVAFDFAHIGKDIHTHNVASHLPNFDSWTTEQVYANFGEPEKEPISRYDNQPLGPEAPPYAVQPSYFWSIDEEDLAKQIKIIDFGEASFSKDERKALHTPLPFRAPESFFGESIGPPADMWAFGCTVFDIFGNGHLFEGFMPSKDVFLLEIVSCLGKLPPQWWQQWHSRCFFSSSDGTPRTDKYGPVYEQSISLALRIKEMRSSGSDQPQEALGPFKPEELADLENLLTAILKYLPSERMTAEDVSKLKWIREQCLTTGANDSNISCADPLPSQSEIVSEKG